MKRGSLGLATAPGLSTGTWAVFPGSAYPCLPPASCTSPFPHPRFPCGWGTGLSHPRLSDWAPLLPALSFPCSELACPPAHRLLSGGVSWTNTLLSSTAAYNSLLLLLSPAPGHSLSKPDPPLGAAQASGLSAAPHLCPAGPRPSLDVPRPSLPSLAPEPWCCVARRSDAHGLQETVPSAPPIGCPNERLLAPMRG